MRLLRAIREGAELVVVAFVVVILLPIFEPSPPEPGDAYWHRAAEGIDE